MRLSEVEYEQLISKKKPVKRQYALGRLKTGTMNKLEAEYSQFLEAEKHLGRVQWWKFEGVKLRLADNTFYTPDFALINSQGEIEIHETKGYWEDDARVKIKVAAEMYPFRFKGIKKRPLKHGGGWDIEEF